MLPGLRSPTGQLYVTAGPPSASDPRMAGFALKPTGEVYVAGGAAPWSPADLFANGEEGVWYDPSDLSTMFQVSVGTIPVTADGQPVGLILDKRVQPVSITSLPVMTCSPTVSQNGNVLTFDASPSGDQASGDPPINPKYFYRMSFTVAGTGDVAVYVGGAPSIFGPGTYTLVPWFAAGATYFIFRAGSGGFDGTVTFTELLEYGGNHAVQATDAARPLYKTDGTYHWLQFDGVDDGLGTAAINFTATDKASAFAGVRKTNTIAAFNVLFETDGAPRNFGLFAPDSNNSNYSFWLKNESRPTLQNYVSPITNVLSVMYDCSEVTAALQTKVRINQEDITLIPANAAAAGNFSSQPLYIGSRANSSLYLTGNVYPLIVRGTLCTPEEIINTETWVNSKTGAY